MIISVGARSIILKEERLCMFLGNDLTELKPCSRGNEAN